MDSLLRTLVGQTVTVYTISSQSSFSDTGMLDSYDEQFIRLRDKKGQTLYFPIANIRLIKPAA
ncbi:MAG TPA: hypothetical protein VGM37_15580 [Armatimonadota bacterium]